MKASTGQRREVETATQEAMLGKAVCELYRSKAGEQNVGRPADHSYYCFGILSNSRDLLACEWGLRALGKNRFSTSSGSWGWLQGWWPSINSGVVPISNLRIAIYCNDSLWWWWCGVVWWYLSDSNTTLGYTAMLCPGLWKY